MRRALCLLMMLAAGLLFARATHAEDGGSQLDHTEVFERAYASSFYEFDACGDALAGRAWRAALVDKFRHCPFSAEAKARFQRRSVAQRMKASEAIAHMIEDHGGLPVRLEGMSRTCREQFDSAEYAAVQRKLDDYTAGRSSADAVITGGCDVSAITP